MRLPFASKTLDDVKWMLLFWSEWCCRPDEEIDNLTGMVAQLTHHHSDGVGSWSLVRRYNLASPQKSIKSIVIVTKLSFANHQNKTYIFHYNRYKTRRNRFLFFSKNNFPKGIYKMVFKSVFIYMIILIWIRPCFEIMSWKPWVCQTYSLNIMTNVQLVV